MATNGSNAVFFLGTRAHYQVLNPPESQFDIENGNASTETIYQHSSVQELCPSDQNRSVSSVQELWPREQKVDLDNQSVLDEHLDNMKVIRRGTSETALCEKNDMKPALLNNVADSTPEKKCTKTTLLTFLWSLARRKRKMDTEDDYGNLKHIHDFSNIKCTYRESCRCLDCQSRYFECTSEDEYSSDDSFASRYVTSQVVETRNHHVEIEEDDDEVFLSPVPEDNTSTDLLLDNQKAVSYTSSVVTVEPAPSDEEEMNLDVLAGTPVLLNHLLNHPITCTIQ